MYTPCICHENVGLGSICDWLLDDTVNVFSVLFAAAAILFALHAGGFKCSGVILVELIEKYDGVYSEATLLWVFTVKYILTGLMGKHD